MQRGKQVLRGKASCSAQSSLDIKRKVQYKITPLLSLHISTSNPPVFPPLLYLCSFSLHENNISPDSTALSQTALQQALLGGTLWGQESVAQDKHPGPNFIIWGTVICLHSHVSDDDRVYLVPNHMNFVLEATRNLNWCLAQLLVVQVWLRPSISSVVVSTDADHSTTSKISMNSQKTGLFCSTTLSLHSCPSVISCTINPNKWHIFPNNRLKAIMMAMASIIWVFTFSFLSF